MLLSEGQLDEMFKDLSKEHFNFLEKRLLGMIKKYKSVTIRMIVGKIARRIENVSAIKLSKAKLYMLVERDFDDMVDDIDLQEFLISKLDFSFSTIYDDLCDNWSVEDFVNYKTYKGCYETTKDWLMDSNSDILMGLHSEFELYLLNTIWSEYDFIDMKELYL